MESKILLEAFELEEKSNELLRKANEIIGSDLNNIEQLKRDQADQILSLDTIRKICLKYRLRFLDIQLFKGEVPLEARIKIKEIENRYNTKLKPLRIIAPGRFFELDFKDKDPILLAKLEDGKYLFVHKWGGEMNFFRKLVMWPMRSVKNMLIGLALLSVVIAALLLQITGSWDTHPIQILGGIGLILLGFCGFTVFLCLAFNVYPSDLNWNSRFLDR